MNRYLIISIILCFTALALHAQDTIRVTVKYSVTKDVIRLRWAVDSPAAWYYTNKHGMTVERYTLMRDGNVLDTPERRVLTPTPLLPRPLNDWQEIALKDNHAAIIAQALYGDDFEVSGGEVDISRIMAVSQEQEQRYAMSLLAADMSYPAALMAGWGYEDRYVIPGERYLYRIVPLTPDGKKVVETGSAYVSLNDREELPQPLEADAIWGNGSVMITWNYTILERTYNAYYLERSDDEGKTFGRLGNIPLTNLTGGDRMFYNDSITNGKTYHYRIKGLTTFGEEGPPSDTIQGKGVECLIYTPAIISAYPDAKGGAEIRWEFDEWGNDAITSFELRRADTDKGPFVTVAKDLSPTLRTTFYENPMPENYLVIAAIPQVGEETVSFPFFLQMEDSIPPAAPQGLEGEIDSTGVVRLTWKENMEKDLLGYRIHRGQTRGEELVPLNDIVVTQNSFRDSAGIRNLNASVFYGVTALDRRYNQSTLSQVTEIEKPSVIEPSAPFITRCQATSNGVALEWVSGKEALNAFGIYRSEGEERLLIKTIDDPGTTAWTDSTTQNGKRYAYDIVSTGKNGLQSKPSPQVSVTANSTGTGLKIKQFRSEQTRNGVVLKWQIEGTGIKSISLYRSEGEAPMQLWKETDISERGITDSTVRRGTAYGYLLLVKQKNGIPVTAEIKVK